MNPVRALARPLLASVFVSGGIDMLRNARSLAPAAEPVTSKVVEAAQPAVDKVAEAAEAAAPDEVPVPPHVDLPTDPELLTKVNGGVMVGAGLLLALGKLPRLSAAALAATIIPTTFAGHRFWELDDPDERAAQQIHFMKNVGLLGGLALASQDTAGRPSLAWRARHRVADVRDTVAEALPG